MPRRSITDEEIGFIKAMLTRGDRNVDIQFYFNRQDRPVNYGRISGIRSGVYGPNIPEATAEQLGEFLAGFEAAEIGVAVDDAEAAPQTPAQRAAARFERRDNGQWHLSQGETSEQECKREFAHVG